MTTHSLTSPAGRHRPRPHGRGYFLSALLALFASSSPAAEKISPHTADAPLPPLEAARTMIVPDGFHVTLFAGEPDVVQPIGFCIDDRGRLWVAEAHNYPKHGTDPGDRIVVLEDTDGDGAFDIRTVFYDQLNYVTGIEVGFGGAWVMSPPYFYFIPDRNGDDVPDGDPEILLDGFGNHANAHNLANGFAWGPDGWLYGTHGRTNWSMIGKPGTPDAERTRFDGGVYRYHPVRHVWEPYADGSTNPWGIDWDDYGEAFVCNCVNPHLFHVIQGAHYEPWRGRESSQFAYERIDTIADHLHYVGSDLRAALGTEAVLAAGGGHAHCGTMVYLGDNWPDRYRNTVFLNNIHGRRINNDILVRSGSGYTATHGPDLMISQDPWYMGVTLAYGPDGAVYASDWSDTGECHSVRNTRRETGRIYKISYGKTTPTPNVNIATLSDAELVALQSHRNDWHVRHARRVLQERAAAGSDMTAVHEKLRAIFAQETDVPRKLRALWALHVTGGLDDPFLIAQLDHESEYVRAWAVTLLCEVREPTCDALSQFCELAATGVPPLVRLHLASALQRLEPGARWPIVEALATRAEDIDDQNLPLMVWYATEALVDVDLSRFVSLTETTPIPLLRRHIARRAVASAHPGQALDLLVSQLSASSDPAFQSDLLTGILLGLEGSRTVPLPEHWPAAYARLQQRADDAVLDDAVRLALIFDDPVALRSLRALAVNAAGDATARNRAVDALVTKKPDDLAPLLLQLISDPSVRPAALRGLAEYDHPETAARILEHYPSFDAAARQDAVQTLASRKSWATLLLDAVESNAIPRTDLTAYTARQLRNLDDKKLTARVTALWGDVRATPAAVAKQIEAHRKKLTPEALASADSSAGRVLFQNLCATCHKFFGEGGEIGPELTGSQRSNLDYLLENLVDPSAAVSKDFQMQILETSGGRTITGLVASENERAITIRTLNEELVIPVDEVAKRTASSVSIMPEGMLQAFSPDQLRDLIAYLSSPHQVPLP